MMKNLTKYGFGIFFLLQLGKSYGQALDTITFLNYKYTKVDSISKSGHEIYENNQNDQRRLIIISDGQIIKYERQYYKDVDVHVKIKGAPSSQILFYKNKLLLLNQYDPIDSTLIEICFYGNGRKQFQSESYFKFINDEYSEYPLKWTYYNRRGKIKKIVYFKNGAKQKTEMFRFGKSHSQNPTEE